jgi:formylglycine-generating enzyme required for sulfatase activity
VHTFSAYPHEISLSLPGSQAVSVKLFVRLRLFVFLVVFMERAVWAQAIYGKGFIPDENGTNLDAAQSGKITPTLASGTIIKDCAECPEMLVIPAGSFVMGSERNADEKPPHTVQIRSFLIGRTEVTQKQWLDVMGSNPSRFSGCGPECPVESVSWDEAQQFISKLNQKTGNKYRLPSEAEWEYAARAGTTTDWSFGNDESKLENYAWYLANSANKTQLVGQKLPNAFGLYDMHGNVWEWTQDCWHDNYAGAPTDGSAWTTVWTASCSDKHRVLRGGSWEHIPAFLRSAFRGKSGPDDRFYISGFRLARTLFTP